MANAAGTGLETKFQEFGTEARPDRRCEIAGYASLFGIADQGGDVVAPGAYAGGLRRMAQAHRRG
jgi:uncharacterized protein